MPLALRAGFDAARLRLCARRSGEADQVRRLSALAASLRRRITCRGRRDRRRDAADRAGLGGSFNEGGPEALVTR